MRKLYVRAAMGAMMLIPLIRNIQRHTTESGLTVHYIRIEWMGYMLNFVFGVADLSADYAEYTKHLTEEE
jgi:hypothetical protein